MLGKEMLLGRTRSEIASITGFPSGEETSTLPTFYLDNAVTEDTQDDELLYQAEWSEESVHFELPIGSVIYVTYRYATRSTRAGEPGAIYATPLTGCEMAMEYGGGTWIRILEPVATFRYGARG